MIAPPIPAVWEGDCWRPSRNFARVADRHYVIGEVYSLVTEEQRSHASHAHYFACVRDAWLNLNEHDAERFPTAEALRKFALIKSGYRDERSIVCASKAEAARVAAFIKPMDDYAIVTASIPPSRSPCERWGERSSAKVKQRSWPFSPV
jgi:hypothetical protein